MNVCVLCFALHVGVQKRTIAVQSDPPSGYKIKIELHTKTTTAKPQVNVSAKIHLFSPLEIMNVFIILLDNLAKTTCKNALTCVFHVLLAQFNLLFDLILFVLSDTKVPTR